MTARNARPRVLIYRDFLLPGSETFIRNQAEGLRGFEPYYGGLKTVAGIALPPERTITVADGRLGRVGSAAFTRLGISPGFAWRVWKLRPSLIHAHFGVDGSRVMRLARVLRIPLLVTLHDYDITTSDAELRKLAPYCDRYIARRPELTRAAGAFLAVSAFIKRKAIERGFPERKILVHYIGIDTSRFVPSVGAGSEPIVLFVGRLVAKKGLRYLLQAMAEVQRARPEAELVVVGDGPLRSELEAQAAGSLSRYRFLGALPSDSVREWYGRARVFCAPSVTSESGETEGLPITVLEAQAMGLPIVSTVHSGIPEAVVDGKSGLLVAERDAAALGARIRSLFDNPHLASELGAAARESVLSRFDMRRQTEILEDIYAQLASRPNDVPRPST